MRGVREAEIDVLSYAPARGIPATIEALVRFYADTGIELSEKDLRVTIGGSEAFAFALQTACNPGDEVLIPEPFYPNYAGHALMNGDPASAIAAAGKQIAYVHFSDNNGLADEHKMPTRGKLDCNAIADALSAVNYAGTLMLEVFRPVEALDEMIAADYATRLKQILARASGD